jgi:hypothetical protein
LAKGEDLSMAHDTIPGESAPTRVDWRQVGVLAALMVPVILLWPTWVVYPLKVLVVFFHELSHGLVAIATGGRVDHIEVVKEQGGLCVTGGGSRFLTLSAGYLGSLVWGGVALMLASRTRRDRAVTGSLGAIVLAATLAWVRPVVSFGFGFHLAVAATLLLAAGLLPEAVNDAFLKVFGLTSCLYVIGDIWSDTITGSGLVSDARMLSDLTLVPTVVWGAAWIALALVLASYFLLTSCRRRPALPQAGLAHAPGGPSSR